jgi:hypothetical protein
MIAIIIESAQAGKSEQNHIARILELSKIDNNFFKDKLQREVVFYKMKGKGELLKIENYSAIIQKVDKLFFILDADDEYVATKTKIETLIKKIEKKCDYFISCNPDSKRGFLESLLLNCVDKNLKECYNSFLECIGKNSLQKYQDKAILTKLFEIKNPPYDVNCNYFNQLKDRFYNL